MNSLSTSDYDIVEGDIKANLSAFLDVVNFTRLCIISDENTQVDCLPLLSDILPKNTVQIVIPTGEKHKNIQTCQLIWKRMMDSQLDRNALVLNVGGGVLGDMGGFCAATYKRGLRFVQIPTTVLSQVDASVGGKLGIDFQGVKNGIGLFQNPIRVFLDTKFFDTLPDRERRSGLAEIIKHSLIADKKEWNELRQITSMKEIKWRELVWRSVQIKHKIVKEDPFEKGIRKALNFGHTVGHALESYFLDHSNALLHGEAVAWGMMVETHLSHKLLGLAPLEYENIISFISKIYPEIKRSPLDYNALVHLMKNDKKNRGSEINCSLIPSIGKVKVNQSVSEKTVIESLAFFSEK